MPRKSASMASTDMLQWQELDTSYYLNATLIMFASTIPSTYVLFAGGIRTHSSLSLRAGEGS